jgi:hypothetical protein
MARKLSHAWNFTGPDLRAQLAQLVNSCHDSFLCIAAGEKPIFILTGDPLEALLSRSAEGSQSAPSTEEGENKGTDHRQAPAGGGGLNFGADQVQSKREDLQRFEACFNDGARTSVCLL